MHEMTEIILERINEMDRRNAKTEQKVNEIYEIIGK